ncbi:MAG: hypothetical protein PHX87_06420 [Candidatus Peribacteraceae bacterium]|nr:hypothetical protein [Candidatus Peribacteraceae bacterium]MDD5743024.1 hypothetical protein [Candidatus Peribacteraceae bacterium]
MRTTLALVLSLLQLSLPLSALAATAVDDLSSSQEQQQQWDTECRASLPFGQGDLEGALQTLLSRCVNRKQNAWLIDQKLAKERERLSQRDAREQARRENILSRLRAGTQQRIANALPRRAEQATLLLRYRTRRRYELIHQEIRQPGSTNATTED